MNLLNNGRPPDATDPTDDNRYAPDAPVLAAHVAECDGAAGNGGGSRKTKDGGCMTLKNLATEAPSGNFIAFFSDGSGAELFCVCDDGSVVASEGCTVCEVAIVQEDLMDRGYLHWMPLPDDFEFWFMQKGE